MIAVCLYGAYLGGLDASGLPFYSYYAPGFGLGRFYVLGKSSSCIRRI